jgi:hypothetical protein
LKSPANTYDQTYLNVSFGFRACRNGEWAVAAYGPDFDNASLDEQQLWTGFEIVDEETFIPAEDDPRFQKWLRRYIMGDWNIEDGPIAALSDVVAQVNAITECVVNEPLWSFANIRALSFPSVQNTHRYQDAHAELYKLVIDGLNKNAIQELGAKLNIIIKPGHKKTVDALEMLFPSEPVRSFVWEPFDRVSEERRTATHKRRPRSEAFPAFEEFGKDVMALLRAVETARDDLAQRLDVNVARCVKRASALRSLPAFDESRPTLPNYGVFQANEMNGRQVVRVQTGELIAAFGTPEREAIVLEFSDGSLMSIEAAAHIAQGIEEAAIGPEALRARLYVTFVPPMLPFS